MSWWDDFVDRGAPSTPLDDSLNGVGESALADILTASRACSFGDAAWSGISFEGDAAWSSIPDGLSAHDPLEADALARSTSADSLKRLAEHDEENMLTPWGEHGCDKQDSGVIRVFSLPAGQHRRGYEEYLADVQRAGVVRSGVHKKPPARKKRERNRETNDRKSVQEPQHDEDRRRSTRPGLKRPDYVNLNEGELVRT